MIADFRVLSTISRLILVALRLLTLAAVWLPLTAFATTLDQVVGQTFASGGLTFEFTSVATVGNVPLSHFELQLNTVSDFNLTILDFSVPSSVPPYPSNWQVFGGRSESVTMEYMVRASTPVQATLVGLGGSIAGLVAGGYSGATSMQQLIAEAPSAVATSCMSVPVPCQESGEVSIDPQLNTLHITTTIRAEAGAGAFVTVSQITQLFTVVPEPSTGLLVMAGLVGLAYQKRRHERAQIV